MASSDFHTTFQVDASPERAFRAVNRVGGWWSGEVTGETDRVGGRFTYRVPGVHECTMEVEELVPGERVVWRVLSCRIHFLDPQDEWTGTRMRFDIARRGGRAEVRFTHVGLVPGLVCYRVCADAWGTLVRGNLRALVRTGEDQPSPWA